MCNELLEGLFDLEGKVAVVTGGGGVLGGTMCRAFGKLRMKVAVLDILDEAAQRAATEVSDAGGEGLAVVVDVLRKESVEEAAGKVTDAFGRVDILVNGAGGNKKEATTTPPGVEPEMSFFDLPADAVRWVFDLNCLGTVLPCQVFAKIMADQGEGIILNISSMAAYHPLTRVPAYSAAKAAISNFTEWLAVHMAQEYSPKIRVNAIAPGFFLTEQNRFLLTDEKTGELTKRGKTIISQTPMRRFGDPEELIGAVIWLLSPASQFVHGTVVAIDGGFNAFSGV